MRDLGTDLREYFDAMADRLPPVVAEPTDVPSRRARRQPVWLAVAAVLVVVVLIAGFLVARDSGDGDQRIHTPAGLDVDRIQAGWERQTGAVPENGFVADVASGPNGAVAVGLRGASTRGPTVPAIWPLVGQGLWSPISFATSGASRVDGVAYWNGLYWASGTLDTGGAITWRSADRVTWEVVGTTQELRTGARLAADGLGLIAYGFGGIAVSTDGGVTWTRGDLDGAIEGVARMGDRLYAMVGPSSANVRKATIWSSSDGVRWEQIADLGALSDPGDATIATWRNALWAVTYPSSADQRSRVWRSEDGTNWSPVDADLPENTAVDTLTALDGYLVATGFDTGSRPGGWVSTDGQSWIPMPDALERPPGGRLNRAVAYGGRVTALSTSELRDAYIWSEPTGATRVTPTTSNTTAPAEAGGAASGMPPSIIAVRGGLIVELDPTSGAVIRTISPSKGLPWHELTVAGPSTAFVADGRSPTGCNAGPTGLGFVRVDLPSGDLEAIPTDPSVSGAGSAIASPDGSSVAYLEGSCLGTADSAHTLAIRSLIDGRTRRFRLPARLAGDTRWDIIWIGGWAADSRHLLVRVQHEPGYEWWVVDTDQDPNQPLEGDVVPASPDEPPGGFVITPLGVTGRWITPVPTSEPGNYDRLVEVDLATGRTGSVLYDWPALTEATQARVVDSDPSGEHLLLILNERGGSSSLYRWSSGDRTPVKVADNINDAAWSRQPPAPTGLAHVYDIVIYERGRCLTADGVEVSCDQPHGNEEFARYSIRDSFDPAAPSLDPVTACESLFEDYTGLRLESVRSQFSVLRISGGALAWCALAGPRGAIDTKVGSARRAP